MENKFIKLSFFFILLVISFVLTACGKVDEKSVLKNLESRINKNNYKLKGDLEIVNNDDIYNYNVEVSYKKENNYKVSLINKSNNHEQIILKNKDGVYVLTPSLNKSFKFQSDWPYNNSQIYLLKSILNDINSDNNRTFSNKKDKFTFITNVNYPNNRKLVKQKIVLDKKYNLLKVEVMNEDNVPQITMKFNKIDYSPTFNKDYFDLETVMESSNLDEKVETTGKLENTLYPLVLPTGTKLSSEEKVTKDNGERIIMTFSGEKSFLLVEENSIKSEELSVIPTFGEPYQLMDSYGIITDSSITWTSGGVDYYIVSDVMSQDELIEVAKSINSIPAMK